MSNKTTTKLARLDDKDTELFNDIKVQMNHGSDSEVIRCAIQCYANWINQQAVIR